MFYDAIAPYYDLLVGDEDARRRWVSFTLAHASGNCLLDLACGSGDVTIALSQYFEEVRGCDLSAEMIKRAKAKPHAERVKFFVEDMGELKDQNQYDVITCYCDSLNYITHEEKIIHLFQRVYQALTEHGTFLFDVHSLDRLTEFEEEFIEEGRCV